GRGVAGRRPCLLAACCCQPPSQPFHPSALVVAVGRTRAAPERLHFLPPGVVHLVQLVRPATATASLAPVPPVPLVPLLAGDIAEWLRPGLPTSSLARLLVRWFETGGVTAPGASAFSPPDAG